MSTFLSIPNEVAGKVVLVTGAASGIGRSIAELMHQRGARVIAEDVQPEVNQLAAENLIPLVADITADGAAEQAVTLAQSAFGRLDILVNCAGRILYKPLIELTREEWQLTSLGGNCGEDPCIIWLLLVHWSLLCATPAALIWLSISHRKSFSPAVSIPPAPGWALWASARPMWCLPWWAC
ncbi:hypothetical protein SODG_001056 [Sodalis praecaptivus]